MSKLEDKIEDLSYEDLVEYALDLEKQLEERDNEISELSKGQTGKGKKRGAGSQGDFSSLEEEIRELREKNDNDQLTINKLREDLASSNIKIQTIQEEKAELDRKFRAQSKRLEDLEKENNNILRKSQAAENQSREINKLKSANIKISQQLTQENDQLKDEVKELTNQKKQLEEEKQQLEELLIKFAEDKEEMEARHDNLDVATNDYKLEIAELKNDLEEIAEKLQVSIDAENEWEKKYQQCQQEMNTIKAQSSLDTKQLKIENEQLLQQIASLKDNTGIGKVHKEVDILNQRLYEAKKRNDDLESNLHEVTQQRDTLLEQLLDYEENIDQKIIDKKTYEETKTKTLEATIDNLKNQLKSDHDYYQALEKEKLNLTQEIDDLTNWKAIYEAGHGLQQLSRNQKKLTDDNRRLIQALEQRTSQIDILMDANNILSLAFEKLKKETGKPANFRYPELELREEVQSTIFTLSFQLQKLEDEVNTLESENTKLRKTLRENLSTTFADKIKDGKLEIPFDDRSRQLAQENKQLKADLQILNNQLLKYESLHQKKKRKVKLPKEKSSTTDVNQITETQQKKSTEPSTQEKDLGHGTIRRPSMDSRQDHEEEGDENYDELDYYHSTDTGGILNDAFGSDIKTLLSENTLLHKKITDLQLQLDTLIKQQNLSVYVKVDDLAAIVSENNELILKELEEVRKSASNLQPQLLLSDRSNETTSLPPMARPRSARINEQSTSRLPTGKKLSVELATPSKDQKSIAGTPFWTPNMARGGMPFPSPMQNPVHAGTPSGPNTPYGKQLLNSTLYHMNLPPEEWAGEVKDLTFHLMESLEQLYEREQDLEVQKSLVKKFEENLVEIKLQMTLLYHEFANSKETWSKKEKEILGENKVLLNERDDLKLKLKRTQDILNLLQKNETNKDSLELKLIELTRKITIYEVNENILSRKYISLNEILEVETKRRLELQNDFIEMESLLKQRILYLEQYKIRSSSRLSFVQMKLDSCVPQDDYLAVQLELENLREDHLNTLRREIETRVNILKILHKEKEYNQMKLVFQQRSIEVEKLNNQVLSLEKELIHQKELTNRALVSANSTVEISNLVSEMARYRGEVSRLEVELLSSNQKLELLTTNINDCLGENDKLMNRVKELEKRESEYLDKESSARKELLQMKLNYEKGLTREEKEKLQHDLLELRKQLEEKSADSLKYKELLDISQNQMTVMQEFKASFENELKELREYCNKLESRSEDEILIGRLQRQLISTKASYKSFVRKYHSLRENIRKREIAMRILENSLTEKEKEFFLEKERSLLTINSLRKAIKNIKETIVQSTPNLMETTINTGLEKKGSDNANGGQKLIQVRANNAWGKNKYYTLGLGEKLVEISEKVETLAELAENSVQKAMAKDEETRNLQNNVEDLELERAILTQRLRDLEVFAASNSANVQNPSSKQSHQQQVANRLIALSEEIRITKLSNLQQRRTIQMMREEIKHLKNVISKMELDVNELEKGKIELEVSKSIFFDHPNKKGKKRNTSLESALDENESDLIDDNSLEAEIEELLNFKTLKNDKSARNLMDSQLKRSLSKLSIDIEDPEQKEENEEMDRKLQLLNDQLFSSKKENSELQLKNNSLSGKIDDMSHLLNEKEQQLNFYERVLHEHGLQNILLRNRGNSMGSSHPGHHSNHRDFQIMPEEQEKLQEAASATIGSLKSIIEEKNHIIDKLREKVDELTAQAIPNSKSRTDKRVDDILDEIANDEAERRFTARGTSSPIKGHTPAHVGALGMNLEHLQKLQDQLAAADEIIKEKDDTVQQLESRLAMETNSRERAENRCGEALKEIEAMKEDMMTLYNQLQDQNQRNAHLAPSLLPKPTSPPRSPERKTQNDNYDFKESMEVEEVRSTNMKLLKKNKDMEKLIKQKDEKMKNYREIIIKLKEEFIKMEEERVTDDIFSNRKDKSGGDSDDERGRIISQNELKELKDKISDLHAGLKNAKTDLEKAKKQREKLHHEKQLATEEIIKLNDELGKKEQQLVYATNMTNKFKRDLEDAKRKEVRMKEKMKEMAQNNSNVKKDSENETGGHGIAVPKNLKDAYFKAKDHIQHLENENELLRAQIAAFGKGNKMESLQKEFREYSSRPLEEGKEELHPNRTQSGGYILGNGASNAADEWKQQSQQRWELEKKLQKRVGQLEKKLSEVTNENDELKGQLLKTKDNLQHATSAKDEISKKMQNANKQVHETKKLTMQEISELDQANARIFNLEDELNQLRRKADVDQTNQIRMLQQQLSACHSKIKSLEMEIIESEDRRKRIAADRIGGGTMSRTQQLRESEERFLKEEKLKDDYDHLQRVKLELESLLLERDNKILEAKFDLESNRQEIDRLRRRNSELELAFKTLQAVASNSIHNPTNPNAVSTLSREEERLLNMPIGALVGDVFTTPTMRSQTAGTSGRPSHIQASKREMELENVVETLKKIIEKFKLENDRLKRGIGVGAQGSNAITATNNSGITGNNIATPDVKKLQEKFQQEKKKNEKLENDFHSLQTKHQELESEYQKLQTKFNAQANLRKQLKNKENEIIINTNEISQLKLENENHMKKIAFLEEKLRTAGNNPSLTQSSNFNKDVSSQLTQQLTENDLLRKEITELRKKLTLQTSEILNLRENYLSKSGTNNAAGKDKFSSTVDLAEINRLREENRKLKDELSAFDLDFFEEIENLKFAHAEAMRKLRQYEANAGRR